MKLIIQPDMFNTDVMNVTCAENSQFIGSITTKGENAFYAQSAFNAEATFTQYDIAVKFIRTIAAKRMKYTDSVPDRQTTLTLL